MLMPESYSHPMTRNKGSAQTLIEFSRREFNRQRKLFIQQVPPITHQDVKEYMAGFVPADIVISKRLQHVIITLKCSDDVDKAIIALKNRRLGGHPVQLELYPRRMMLYICGVPLHYTDRDFRKFLALYGEVETAFLSVTSQGLSKGYGFVEFAHNRATLEKVEQRLNGSVLNGQILYCGLVSDTIRVFEDTFSTSLFCLCSHGNPPAFPNPSDSSFSIRSFQMPNGCKLYVLECRDTMTAEKLWYQSCMVSESTGEPLLRYAMPAVSAEELATLIQNSWRGPEMQGPGPNSGLEQTRCNIHSLFNHQPQLARAVESLVSRLAPKLEVHPLSTETIMELAKALQPSIGTQATTSFLSELPTLPSRPPGSTFNQDSYSNGDVSYQGPLTRARFQTARNVALFGLQMHAEAMPSTGCCLAHSATSNFSDQTDLVGNNELKEQMYGHAHEDSALGIARNRRAKSPGHSRKRRNSGRSNVDSELVPHGWSTWDGFEYKSSSHASGCLKTSSCREDKENHRRAAILTSTPDNGPVAKRAFRKTPGAEKRESRLLQALSDQRTPAPPSDNKGRRLGHATLTNCQLDPGPRVLPIGQHNQGLGICYGNSYVPFVKDKTG
ncbi:ribonucleoprotein PTB-binding 2-like [Watersipora subatra]|uniref:ribonucleoprotein PTB-binding 2-like n=1 Tax=Watersipora subatra TaxID=2589382 RepID=UPI00355BCE50